MHLLGLPGHANALESAVFSYEERLSNAQGKRFAKQTQVALFEKWSAGATTVENAVFSARDGSVTPRKKEFAKQTHVTLCG